jgi:hypothetical protein
MFGTRVGEWRGSAIPAIRISTATFNRNFRDLSIPSISRSPLNFGLTRFLTGNDEALGAYLKASDLWN